MGPLKKWGKHFPPPRTQYVVDEIGILTTHWLFWTFGHGLVQAARDIHKQRRPRRTALVVFGNGASRTRETGQLADLGEDGTVKVAIHAGLLRVSIGGPDKNLCGQLFNGRGGKVHQPLLKGP